MARYEGVSRKSYYLCAGLAVFLYIVSARPAHATDPVAEREKTLWQAISEVPAQNPAEITSVRNLGVGSCMSKKATDVSDIHITLGHTDPAVMPAFHIYYLPMAQSQVNHAQLLMTGIFHGNEVAAQTGEKWLALVSSGDGYALKETRLGIEFVRDEIIDEDGQATAKKVFIDLDKKPLFLVRGIPGIAAGPVETAVAQSLYLKIGSVVPFKLSNGRHYELTVDCDQNGPLTVDHFGECPLILEAPSKTQKIQNFQIYSPPGAKPVYAGDASPAVIWAGDMNTDGALDLLIDVSNHYNTSELTLFLSSDTPSDSLVIRAAAFITSGC